MRRPGLVVLAVCLFATPASLTTQEPIITTVAGGGPDQVLLADATLIPHGLMLDGSGNLYITAQSQSRVFRVSPSGLVSIVAGSGVSDYSDVCGDGIPASEACFTSPEASALDTTGNLFISDSYNHRIRRVDAVTGIVTTVAGHGVQTGEIDGEGGEPADDLGDAGPATSATLYYPRGVAVDAAGNLLIADSANHRIRRVDAVSGTITTIAGTGDMGFNGDGIPATAAELAHPGELALDAHGSILVADTTNARIRRIDAATGLIGTVAGNGLATGQIDGEGGDPSDDLGDGGPATMATLYPRGVSADGSGNIMIADTNNHRVRRVDSTSGTITTVAGVGVGTGFIDGPGGDPADDFTDGVPATSTTLLSPTSAVADAAGNIFIADNSNADVSNYRLRKVDGATGLITSLGGQPGFANGDGGQATLAQLFEVRGVATDAGGNLFIGAGDRVRRILAGSGVITTVAGCIDPANCHSGYGLPATETMLNDVISVAISPAGELTIGLDPFRERRVVKVEAGTGLVRHLAGGGSGQDGGPATEADIDGPWGLEFDAAGNLFISQSGWPLFNDRDSVRRIDAATAVITTVAGVSFPDPPPTPPMDGVPAVGTRLLSPIGVALDAAGNLFISENARVRRVDAVTGIITTIAGTLQPGSSGDGVPATEARLCRPAGLDLDGNGGLLIAENCGARVRRVDLSTGIIETVAGNGQYGFGGDGGPALDARLAGPFAVAARPAGGFFVGDYDAQRVRLVAVIAPPVADAGPDQEVECSSVLGTPVALDGSGSTGTGLSYLWTGPFPEGDGAATGIGPTVSLPIGVSTISLVVGQGQLESVADVVDVRVTVSPHGLSSPLADLVPAGEAPPLPRKAFQQGSTLSLRLSMSCGSMTLTDGDVSAPRLTALEAEGQVIPIPLGRLRGVSESGAGVSFEYGGDGQWGLRLRTSELPADIYRATIEMPDGRRFVAGFQLR